MRYAVTHLCGLGFAATLAAPVRVPEPSSPAEVAPVRIVLAYLRPATRDDNHWDFERGATLGIAEARHVAELLRRELDVLELEETGSLSLSEQLAEANVSVLVTSGVNDILASRLGLWASRPGRAIITSWAGGVACRMPIFRTGSQGPTGRISARLGTWGRPVFATPRLDPSTQLLTTVELWHRDLDRFGARQLNRRFEQLHGRPMSSAAWEGWMAVKVAWESALRAQDGDVASAIRRSTFDGHKGSALRFGENDRTLHQPLVIVAHASDSLSQQVRALGHVTPTKLVREIPWPTEARAADSAPRSIMDCP